VIPHTVFKETDMAMKARKKAKAAKAKRKPAKTAKKTKVAKKAKKAAKAKAKKKAPVRTAKAKKTKAKRAPAKRGVVKTVTKAAKTIVAAAKRAVGQGPKKKDVIGEGNYTASRNFREKETNFIDHNRETIARKAKEAEAAIDGPEGAELERAREETAARGQE
jgi:hypothetical protein